MLGGGLEMKLMTVKVNNDSNKVKYIPVIRKFSSDSMSEIKEEIETGLPVLKCDYIKEPDRLIAFYETAQKLEDMGAKLEVYQKDRKIDLGLVKNQIESHKETVRQIEEMDAELFED